MQPAGSRATPSPFTVRIADEVLVDLRARLSHARWPDEVPGGGWRYGTDATYLRELIEYWRTKYDWRAQEARLNQFRHFKLSLADIDLHYIHQPGIGAAPMPLLLLHG